MSIVNLSHAGGVLVFKNYLSNEWDKFAIGFNYRITKDFTDDILRLRGNEAGVPSFDSNFP
jgi:hypothetical protein